MANLTGQNIKDTYQELVTVGINDTITDGTGSLISLLNVTASEAIHATNAVTASFALNVTPIDTGSFMITGSVVDNTLTFEKADGSVFNLTVDTGSAVSSSYSAYAVSASHATYSETAGSATTATSSSYALNASSADSAISASYAGNASTADSALTATSASHALYADAAGTADSAATATSASYASNASTADSALAATSSSYALNASTADSATSASYASNASTADSATSASYAGNAELLDGLDSSAFAQLAVDNTFTGTQTFNNIAVNGTGSFAYITSVTGSAKIIGDAYIILNNDLPTERFAGIVVQDSGSGAPLTTASLEFDGLYNDWFYEYSDDGGVTTDHGVVLFGPEYATKGTPTYPTANVLQKGNGGHHLLDSNITDNGTLVSISTPVDVTGGVTASLGFKGALDGNAATATTASYAVTASYLDGGIPHTEGLIQGTGTDSAISSFPTFAATGSGQEAVAIGKNAKALQYGGVALGGSATSDGFQATALGHSSKAEAGGALSLGSYATNRSADGLTLGNLAEAEGGTGAIAIGKSARGYGNYSIGIGYNAHTTYNYADQIVLGSNSTSTGTNNIIIGANAASSGSNTMTLGNSAITDTYIDGQIHNKGLSYPTADGTSGQVITTDGLGNLSFTTPAGGGGEATAETGDILFENIFGEIYGTAAVPLTGNITISATSTKLDGAVAIIYHQDTAEPLISGATVNKKAGTYDTSTLNIITLTNIDGTNILEYIAGAAAVTALDVKDNGTSIGTIDTLDFVGGEWGLTESPTGEANISVTGVTGTGVTSVDMSNMMGVVYNTAASPATGNITLSTTDAKVGASVIIYHQDTTEPTVSGMTVDKKVGSYDTSALNIISFVHLGSNKVLQTIAGADVTGIVTNSTDSYAGTPDVQHIITCTAAEYAAIGTPDANTFYVVI